jgi:DNA polymerase I-like protein with 3'-5' exonuclease and polymerase domains
VAALVVREMENAVELSVPLKVEVKSGRSWGEMRPLGDALVG